MNEQLGNKVNDKTYIKLTPFKGWVLENFPFIEADFDCITNYQLMCKVTEYLNNVISNQNTVQELGTELVNAYNTLVDDVNNKVDNLESFMNNYFNNLDVQEEINNKLDQMAEDGSLTNLIKGYVDPIYQAYESSINSQVQFIDNKVNSLASGSPLVASSISGMTDTTRVYVNTTNGKWYYYDGDSWEIGGTYQSTGVGSNAVSYTEISPLLKNDDYEVIHANDLLWFFGFSVYQGNYNWSDNNVVSSPFILPKGNTITLSGIHGRITYYSLDGAYIGNTGNIGEITNWSYTEDCIVNITTKSTTDTIITEADCNNDTVIFTGIRNKRINDLLSTLTFTATDDTYVAYSNPLYVGKGSKIGINIGLLQKDGSLITTSPFDIMILEEGVTKTISSSANYQRSDYYNITKNEMIRIMIKFHTANKNITSYLSKLTALISLIYKESYDNEKYYLYTSSNGKINIINGESGAILLNLATDLNLVKYSTQYTINMTTLESNFPSLIQTVNNVKYLKINTQSMLYFDLLDNEFKVNSLANKNTQYGDNIIPIIINRYSNVTGGEAFHLYLKSSLNLQSDIRYELDMFNSQPYATYDWQSIVQNFNKIYKNKSSNIDSYLFFTDQHIMGENGTFNEKTLINYLNKLEKVYNSIPVDFIVSGGDWLNAGDTQDQACFKLGYINGFTRTKFKNYYPILGNHDTNYQGKIDSDSAANSGILPDDTLTNLFFNKFGKNYYSFDGRNNKNYVLDTGSDWSGSMTSYRWGQIDWLADKLTTDDPKHAVVMLHIIWTDNEHHTFVMTDPVTKLINAFNNHTTITLNSKTYDFTRTTGHIDYVLSGHTHYDYNDTINGVLCVATRNFLNSGVVTYDIVINDYDNNKLIMYRVGNGESREFTI